MMDQPAPSADVKPHVIAFGRHTVDVARRDPHQAGEVGRPEFLAGAARPRAVGRPGFAPLEIVAAAVQRAWSRAGSTGFIR